MIVTSPRYWMSVALYALFSMGQFRSALALCCVKKGTQLPSASVRRHLDQTSSSAAKVFHRALAEKCKSITRWIWLQVNRRILSRAVLPAARLAFSCADSSDRPDSSARRRSIVVVQRERQSQQHSSSGGSVTGCCSCSQEHALLSGAAGWALPRVSRYSWTL